MREGVRQMRIDIWSDFACPFCYIGKRNLEKALEELNTSEEVEIVFHSFQLDPNAERENQSNTVSSLAEKYGTSKEEAQKMIDRIVNMAKDVGLNYNYDKIIGTNTLDAHKLVHYAKEENKDEEIIERLFKAYFIEGLDIGDTQVLGKLGEEVGLNREKALEALNSDEYKLKVDEDRYLSQQLGISSVPFFVINNKTAIPGAQPSNVFLQVFKELEE